MRMRGGTDRSRTQSPISGRFRISSRTLPMYMLAMRPQTSSGFFSKRSGPGPEPPEHERAEHDGRRPRAGHAERQERHHRAAARRVVRGLRRRHALDHARPEALRIPGHALLRRGRR